MGGIFGVISTKKCTNDLFFGVDYHSHLGTRRGGMAVYNGNGVFARDIHSLENTYFRVKFEKDILKYTGNSGVGVISDTDAQPIVVNSHLGRFAIVTVGKICNIKALEKELLEQNKNFTELSSGDTNPTELIAQIITCSATFAEGIEQVQKKIKGSCSFLILTENSIIASRDLYGRTPLILGKKDTVDDNGEKIIAHAVATETCSFPNLLYKDEYVLGPGEAIEITAESFHRIVPPKSKKQFCSFMWIYYGYPPSSYENINVDEVRYRLGRSLAQRDDTEIDIVSSIPDSGSCMAIGYSNGKQLPYRSAYVKYTPTWPRSFTPVTQDQRNLVARMKLIPNSSILKDKRLVFCDDSIVRGTQLRNNVRYLYEYGAKEVHIRISCPPLLYPCEFVNFSASKSVLELITRRFIQEKEGDMHKNIEKYADHNSEEYKEMVEYIREQIKAASLKFNTVDELIEGIGLPKEMICTHCFDGSSYGH